MRAATGRCPDSTLLGAVSRSAVSGNNGLRCPGVIVGLKTGWGCSTTLFQDAPLLGSLIDPTSVSEDMLTAGFSELQPSLERALSKHAGEEEWEETAIAALGLTEATRLLSQQYHLVITNVPYLARGKQSERLQNFAERRYARAKKDLANVFLETVSGVLLGSWSWCHPDRNAAKLAVSDQLQDAARASIERSALGACWHGWGLVPLRLSAARS